MADDTALLYHGFDIAPVIDVLACDRFDHPITRCGRAMPLLKLCTTITSAAADDKNYCNPADSSIHWFGFVPDKFCDLTVSHQGRPTLLNFRLRIRVLTLKHQPIPQLRSGVLAARIIDIPSTPNNHLITGNEHRCTAAEGIRVRRQRCPGVELCIVNLSLCVV